MTADAVRRLLAAALVVATVASCGHAPPPKARSSSGAPATTRAPDGPPDDTPTTATCDYQPSGTASRPVRLPATTDVARTGVVVATLQTNEGAVRIRMDRAAAPCTVNSFVSLARQGFFDHTRCPRLVDLRLYFLQCGDPTGKGSGGSGYTFADETSGDETYVAGTVAMASSGPDTNGSQFLLFYDDSTALDATPSYTIFGHLDEASRQVVGRIAEEGEDGSNPHGGGRPNNPAEIVRVTVSG